ncbi:MAG: hypothetical protein ACHQ4H_11850 [Ktedonobacterales bacterium]
MSDGKRDSQQSFRQRLDAVLRQRDPASLRAFLVAAGQWDAEQQADEAAAMWMMIAASRALTDLHGEAERWLMAHGHEHEAQAILGRPATSGRGSDRGSARPAPRRNRAPAQHRHDAPHPPRSPGGTRRPPSGSGGKPRQ